MDYSTWSSSPLWINFGRRGVIHPNSGDLPPRLVHVPSGNTLRLVDLSARTVATVFRTPEPIEAVGVPALSSFAAGHLVKEQPVLVRTRQKIYALNRNYKITKTLTIPAEIDRGIYVYWYEVGNGQAIVAFDRRRSTGEARNVTKRIVYRIADDGAIQDSFELTLQTGSRVPERAGGSLPLALGFRDPRSCSRSGSLIVMETGRVPGAIRRRSGSMLKHFGPSLAAVLALSSVLAMVAWRRSRGFGLSRASRLPGGRSCCSLVFPPTWAFCSSRRWPVRESCPNCHAQAARDRAACAECGARFPEPSLQESRYSPEVTAGIGPA